MDGEGRRLYETSYRKPYGAIFVTGPTGSGKSTSLYATLNEINSIEKKIITIEDPVEHRLNGINEMASIAAPDSTFACSRSAMLRADPDAIMVGEIRDGETARIAIEAALTGTSCSRPFFLLSYERRSRRDRAPAEDGHRVVPHGLGGGLCDRAAPGAKASATCASARP